MLDDSKKRTFYDCIDELDEKLNLEFGTVSS
jgi:hypothetical protein